MNENDTNNSIEGEKKIPAEPQVGVTPEETKTENTATPELTSTTTVPADKLNTSATFNPETGKWEGYKPEKGKTPPWNPFDVNKKKSRITLKERKFMYLLSTTGSMQEAFKGTYKVKDYGDSKLQGQRVSALANQVLKRIRMKAPELVATMTFEDITPDFVRKGLLKLYNDPNASIHEKTRILELMGKTQAMFTDKVQTETKIREIVGTVYRESDEDFPEHDDRVSRVDMEDIDKIGTA